MKQNYYFFLLLLISVLIYPSFVNAADTNWASSANGGVATCDGAACTTINDENLNNYYGATAYHEGHGSASVTGIINFSSATRIDKIEFKDLVQAYMCQSAGATPTYCPGGWASLGTRTRTYSIQYADNSWQTILTENTGAVFPGEVVRTINGPWNNVKAVKAVLSGSASGNNIDTAMVWTYLYEIKAISSSPTYRDIGLRVRDGAQTVSLAAEPSGPITSPLRIAKNGVIYGIALVDPADAFASKVKIKTSSGIKAIRKI